MEETRMEEENIKVVVRIRPLQQSEKKRGDIPCVKVGGGGTEVQIKVGPLDAQVYKCNQCFSAETTQEEFFNGCGIVGLLDSAAAGYRSCAFAFGQTGAGKTYTTLGPSSKGVHWKERHQGLIGRSLEYLYNKLIAMDVRYKITISCLEIYQENVFDLFADEKERASLPVREHATDGFFLEGCKMVECVSHEIAIGAVEVAMKNRQVGGHELNARSSRSHCLTEIHIELPVSEDMRKSLKLPDDHDGNEDAKEYTLKGRMFIVDLAGSERLKSTNSTGKVLQEAGFINRSLYVLGKVIAGLVRTNGDMNHRDVPYRDSKLTKLLISSLGGNTRTLLISCVTEAKGSQAETLRTLKFSMSCARIRNKPVKFMDPHDKLILDLRDQIKRLQRENRKLRSTIGTAPASSGGGAGVGSPEKGGAAPGGHISPYKRSISAYQDKAERLRHSDMRKPKAGVVGAGKQKLVNSRSAAAAVARSHHQNQHQRELLQPLNIYRRPQQQHGNVKSMSELPPTQSSPPIIIHYTNAAGDLEEADEDGSDIGGGGGRRRKAGGGARHSSAFSPNSGGASTAGDYEDDDSSLVSTQSRKLRNAHLQLEDMVRRRATGPMVFKSAGNMQPIKSTHKGSRLHSGAGHHYAAPAPIGSPEDERIRLLEEKIARLESLQMGQRLAAGEEATGRDGHSVAGEVAGERDHGEDDDLSSIGGVSVGAGSYPSAAGQPHSQPRGAAPQRKRAAPAGKKKTKKRADEPASWKTNGKKPSPYIAHLIKHSETSTGGPAHSSSNDSVASSGATSVMSKNGKKKASKPSGGKSGGSGVAASAKQPNKSEDEDPLAAFLSGLDGDSDDSDAPKNGKGKGAMGQQGKKNMAAPAAPLPAARRAAQGASKPPTGRAAAGAAAAAKKPTVAQQRRGVPKAAVQNKSPGQILNPRQGADRGSARVISRRDADGDIGGDEEDGSVSPTAMRANSLPLIKSSANSSRASSQSTSPTDLGAGAAVNRLPDIRNSSGSPGEAQSSQSSAVEAIRRKLAMLEFSLAEQRIEMEDNPGHVTAEAEAKYLYMKEEAQQMKQKLEHETRLAGLHSSYKPSDSDPSRPRSLFENINDPVPDHNPEARAKAGKNPYGDDPYEDGEDALPEPNAVKSIARELSVKQGSIISAILSSAEREASRQSDRPARDALGEVERGSERELTHEERKALEEQQLREILMRPPAEVSTELSANNQSSNIGKSATSDGERRGKGEEEKEGKGGEEEEEEEEEYGDDEDGYEDDEDFDADADAVAAATENTFSLSALTGAIPAISGDSSAENDHKAEEEWQGALSSAVEAKRSSSHSSSSSNHSHSNSNCDSDSKINVDSGAVASALVGLGKGVGAKSADEDYGYEDDDEFADQAAKSADPAAAEALPSVDTQAVEQVVLREPEQLVSANQKEDAVEGEKKEKEEKEDEEEEEDGEGYEDDYDMDFDEESRAQSRATTAGDPSKAAPTHLAGISRVMSSVIEGLEAQHQEQQSSKVTADNSSSDKLVEVALGIGGEEKEEQKEKEKEGEEEGRKQQKLKLSPSSIATSSNSGRLADLATLSNEGSAAKATGAGLNGAEAGRTSENPPKTTGALSADGDDGYGDDDFDDFEDD